MLKACRMAGYLTKAHSSYGAAVAGEKKNTEPERRPRVRIFIVIVFVHFFLLATPRLVSRWQSGKMERK